MQICPFRTRFLFNAYGVVGWEAGFGSQGAGHPGLRCRTASRFLLWFFVVFPERRFFDTSASWRCAGAKTGNAEGVPQQKQSPGWHTLGTQPHRNA